MFRAKLSVVSALGLALLLAGCSTTTEDKTVSWSPNKIHSEAKDEMSSGAYDKAIKANGGKWPTREQVIDATAGLSFATGFGRPVTLRPEDNQGLEAQIVGITKSAPGYDFKVLDNMMLFDAKPITAPAGQKSVDWLKTLPADFYKMNVPTFKHGG